MTALRACILGMVAIGVAVVHAAFQGPSINTSPASFQSTGLVMALVSALCSAAAGVASEALLRRRAGGFRGPAPSSNVWQFNAQMALLSACVTVLRLMLAVFTHDADSWDGVWPQRWPALAWLHLVVAAGGGLLAGLAVKVAGSVSKAVATSCSMVLTSIFSIVCFGVPMQWWGCVGLVLTPLASAWYLLAPSTPTGTRSAAKQHGGLYRSKSSRSLGATSPSALARRAPHKRRSDSEG